MPDLEDLRFFTRKALLSDKFNETLAEVYAEKEALYDTGFEVLFPNEVFTAQLMEVAEQLPYGELNATVSRNRAPDSNVIRLMHDIQIFWHLRHDKEEELETHLNRYMKATRRFFERNQYLDDIGVGPVQLNDDVYSPFVPVTLYNARPFVKSGLLVIYWETFDEH